MKPYSFLQIKKFLLSHGFKITRQTGSHVVFRKDSHVVVVPNHGGKDIPGPTVSSILKQAGLYEKYKKGF